MDMAQNAFKQKNGFMGVPWYTENTWNEMKNICEDKDSFHNNYQEWLAYSDKSIVLLTSQKRPFLRLDIDPISYTWWCKKNSFKMDKISRRAYTEYLLESKLQK